MIFAPFTLLVWDMQSPINLGMILRAAEGFAVPVQIWDPRGVLNTAAAHTAVSDFACGAFERGGVTILPNAPVVPLADGRFVATALDRDDSVQLPEFEFCSTDLVAIGNEYDGLPGEVVAAADVTLHIPMPPVRTPKPASNAAIDPARQGFASTGNGPVLNVAVSGAILCYEASRRAFAAGRY